MGEVLSWQGHPVAAYSTGDCGGLLAVPADLWGAAARGPFIRKPDPWCGLRGPSKWTLELAASELADAIARAAGRSGTPPGPWKFGLLRASGSDDAIVVSFTLRSRGRLLEAAFDAVARRLRALRGSWVLRSRRFDLECRGPRVAFRGNGRGHLAGLCQRGAAEMARAGRSCREILAFYFPGASLERLQPRR